MATHTNKPSPNFRERKNYTGERYGRGYASGNPDPEYGVDARAYGHYRSRNEQENDYRSEGYAGRNAGDYNNRRYSDTYYYNPDQDRGAWRNDADAYRYNDYGDRDFDRNYRKGYPHNANYSQRNEYFDAPGNRDYYGSYPSYGQSWADQERNHSHNDYWYGDNYGAQNRFTNYGRNDNIGYDNRGYDNREEDDRDRRYY